MKPLERIVLRAIQLKSILEWLVKPKGPNLVEATVSGVPEKALVLAVTKCTLYMEGLPSVGVGLVYKPHYVSTESFCCAYMHLNVWHAAASNEDSTNKLDSSRFILVSILEMSEVMPDALLHPVFLDVIDKEAIEETGEPLAPHWFWGFRLHTVWSRPPGEEPVHQIAFPCLRREATALMLEYELEKSPQSMRQGPKVAIPLRPPSSRHWNIESDLTFIIAVDTHRRQHEAKRTGQDQERESAGAEESPRETPAPEGAALATAGSSQAVSPMETTLREEQDLEVALGAVRCIHAIRLQTIHDMGCVREIEQVAAHTLMAEFARLQAILSEDLTKSLSALRLELEASSEVLSADILNVLNLHPGDPGFSRVRELIQKHHQLVLMKVNLPLIELEAAKEDLDRFLQERLRKLGSGPQAQEVLEEITRRLMSYNQRVRETILATPGMEQPRVFNRIMLTLAVEQPMDVVLLPGILDRLSGRLTSARQGVAW